MWSNQYGNQQILKMDFSLRERTELGGETLQLVVINSAHFQMNHTLMPAQF